MWLFIRFVNRRSWNWWRHSSAAADFHAWCGHLSKHCSKHFCFCSFGACWHFYLCKTKSNFVERYKIYLDWRSTIDTVWRNIAFECKQRTINLLIAFLALGSAIREFLKQQNKSHDCAIVISRSKLIFIGAFTGFFSALSGTGGPLILIPLMLWSSVPITIAIGLAQSIQLPISVFATIGNSWSGILNLSVAIPLATGIAFGTYYGGIWIRGVSTSKIKKGVAIILAAIGIAMTISVLI